MRIGRTSGRRRTGAPGYNAAQAVLPIASRGAGGSRDSAAAGIRVLDLSRARGPWCTQLLADLGAEVIKIERPGVGDDTRYWGPPWHGEGDERVAAYFLSANRGRSPRPSTSPGRRARELVRKIAKNCDVVVENFKVGASRNSASMPKHCAPRTRA